ncbi:MAG: hypothetical protein GEV10_31300 [Streptosporangiales bacterium]|nr:hypothetical protein [Streptosporangiales bacterium]
MSADSRAVRRTGVAVATSTAAIGVVSLVIAVTTLPHSGPFCRTGCLGYPYTGGTEFVPRDFVWMYPAALLALLVVPLAAVLGVTRRRPTSGFTAPVALAFAAIAAGVLTVDYGIQLAVVQPSLLTGEVDGLSMISQYNPHGVFIALEDVGYVVMSLAFLAMAPLVGRVTWLEKCVRWTFLAGGVLTPLLLVVLGAWYGAQLEYRFEVASLTVCWLVLIANGIMLTVMFIRGSNQPVARKP